VVKRVITRQHVHPIQIKVVLLKKGHDQRWGEEKRKTYTTGNRDRFVDSFQLIGIDELNSN
jgi:uncharacterized phage-like protein YoqJ